MLDTALANSQEPLKTNEPIRIGVATDHQIAAWKQAERVDEIFQVILKDKKGNRHYGYFRPGNRSTLGAAQMAGAGGNRVSFWEVVADNCWLGGSDSILSDEYLFGGLMTLLVDLYEAADGEIAKL
jgi:hypothetical protein